MLVSKCKALFAKSKWDEGTQALDEARDIFQRLDSVHWLLRYYDIRAKLAFQMKDRLAEMDINPVFVGPKGAVAADALVVLK